VGTPSNPTTFSTNTQITQELALKNGWTWVSFPVNSSAFSSSNNMFAKMFPGNNDQSWSQNLYDVYDTTAGWIGSLTGSGGYDMESAYKIKYSGADTLKVVGAVKMPDIIPISVDSGWNWIGYIALKNAAVSTAMGNYNALEGDILKGQFSFAYYDSIMGWLGSLNTMVPGEGYMLLASDTSTFTYPVTGITGRSSNHLTVSPDANRAVTDEIKPENFRKNMSVIVHSNLCNELMNLHSVLLKV
jgi:hypothetical protein